MGTPAVHKPLAPAIILVRPQLAENIGATARAMVNFGAKDLRLVAPRDFDRVLAGRMACDGRVILDHLRVFPDLRTALADCAFSVATSRRLRRVQVPILTPHETAQRLLDRPGSGRTALVFGAEQAGLTNEEAFLCDAVSSIPTTETASLNLAQAVVVFLYAWFSQTPQPIARPHPLAALATHADKQRSYDLLERLLIATEYKPITRLPEFLRRVKLLFEERPLTQREQKILLKVLRYFEKGIFGPPAKR